MQHITPITVALTVCLSLVAPVPLRAQAGLADLAFMTGCWTGQIGEDGTITIEEHYTAPSANVMLGTTRYLRDGAAIQFEFSLLQADSSGITLLPYPRGVPSTDGFRLTSVEASSDGKYTALFEAPEHDFPKRIAYQGDSRFLQATIDGGPGTNAQTWRMTPAQCVEAR